MPSYFPFLDIDSLDGKRVRFDYIASGKQDLKPQIENDGTPFVVLGVTAWNCHQGPTRFQPGTVSTVSSY